jgi:hypothetical protein
MIGAALDRSVVYRSTDLLAGGNNGDKCRAVQAGMDRQAADQPLSEDVHIGRDAVRVMERKVNVCKLLIGTANSRIRLRK